MLKIYGCFGINLDHAVHSLHHEPESGLTILIGLKGNFDQLLTEPHELLHQQVVNCHIWIERLAKNRHFLKTRVGDLVQVAATETAPQFAFVKFIIASANMVYFVLDFLGAATSLSGEQWHLSHGSPTRGRCIKYVDGISMPLAYAIHPDTGALTVVSPVRF